MIALDTRKIIETGKQANPFPGLRPFEYYENHLFFGRDGQSERLIEKLSRTRFLTVVGTSGSGKSSLARAGLLPALLGGMMTGAGSAWKIALLRPGNNPLGNLSKALNSREAFGSDDQENRSLQIAITEATLRRGNLGLVEAVRQTGLPATENLLVVADQWEELFRTEQSAVKDDNQANDKAAFVKLLIEAAHQREVNIYVVLTMRSDYLGDCSQFQDLPEAINEGQYLIPRLTRNQLREAITGPVAVAGGEITPRLVNRLLNDIGDNQDQLPVLQHLLMRMWDEQKERRLEIEIKDVDATIRRPHKEVHEGEAIDLCCYDAVGGMASALSHHADEAFNELPDERHRLIAEKMFKSLTEKGEDNREIRRPVRFTEICAVTGASATEVEAVINPFRLPGRSFLMPPAGTPLDDNALIDISHESLIRNWQRLKEWVDEEARSARTYRRLAETTALFDVGDERLLQDPALQIALDWREQNKPNEVWAERYHPGFKSAIKFLDDSAEARDAEIEEKERKRRQEIRRARRTTVVFGVLFLLALSAFIFAFSKAAEAKAALGEAEKQKNIALDNEKKAKAAAEEAKTASAREKEAADKEKDAAAKALKKKQEAEDAKALADKQTLIAKENEEKAHKAEKAAQDALAETRIATGKEKIATTNFIRQLYASNISLATEAYESGNLERAQALLNNPAPQSGQENPRGFEWYYLSNLYHRKLASFEANEDAVTSTAFSPDGKMIATGSLGKFEVRSVDTKKLLATFDDRAGDTPSLNTVVAFSPDNKLLATGSSEGFKLRNIASQTTIATLQDGPVGVQLALAFSPDGQRLALGFNQTYRLFDTASHQLIMSLPPDSSTNSDAPESVPSGTALAFSPDGERLLIYVGQNIELWDIASQKKVSDKKIFEGVQNVGFLRSDFLRGYTLFVSDDKAIFLLKPDSGLYSISKVFHIPIGTGLVPNVVLKAKVALSPNRKTFATGVENEVVYGGGVRLWDAESLKPLATFEGLGTDGKVSSLAFSNDGSILAIGGEKTVQLNDANVERASNKIDVRDAFKAMISVPNERKFATLQYTTETTFALKLWETDSGRLLDTFNLGTDDLAAFSPDGRMLATGDGKGSGINLWDVASHRVVNTFALPFDEKNGSLRLGELSAAFSPDGKTLAVGGMNFIEWIDMASHNLVGSWSNSESEAFKLTINSYSHDGKFLAIRYTDEASDSVEIFDAVSRQPLIILPTVGQASITSLAFSANDKVLAIGKNNSTTELWDISSLKTSSRKKSEGSGQLPKLLVTLEGHTESVNSIAFSPDGKTLATGSSDLTVKLWNVPTSQLLLTLEAGAEIEGVTFSSDGQILLAAGKDRQVYLWHAPRGAEKRARSLAPLRIPLTDKPAFSVE